MRSIASRWVVWMSFLAFASACTSEPTSAAPDLRPCLGARRVMIEPDNATVAVNDSVLVATSVDPGCAGEVEVYTWNFESDHADLLRVDQRGWVLALAPGTALIRATVRSSNGGTGSAAVTIHAVAR